VGVPDFPSGPLDNITSLNLLPHLATKIMVKCFGTYGLHYVKAWRTNPVTFLCHTCLRCCMSIKRNTTPDFRWSTFPEVPYGF